jgi:hypothetical protein
MQDSVNCDASEKYSTIYLGATVQIFLSIPGLPLALYQAMEKGNKNIYSGGNWRPGNTRIGKKGASTRTE